jgi:hypothetical protein
VSQYPPSNEQTPAGWYPDASAPGQVRWWDGTAWTEHVHAASATAYTPGQPYAPGTPGQPGALVAPAGTKTNTIWIWLLAALPLIVAIGFTLWDFSGYMRTLLDIEQSGGSTRISDGDMQRLMSSIFTPGYFALLGLSFLTYVLTVVFALLDWSALKKRGVPKPFHWAWGFVPSYGLWVYVIGRSVVVRRRTGQGLAPLFVWIGVVVLSWIISGAIVFGQMGSLMSNISTVR